jgi:predicted SnoaL-like aldol condensation-catalyzing enzyme
MSNKDTAKEFLQLAGSGKVKEAYDRFVSPKFIHHNQYFPGDRQSLLDAMKEAHKKISNKSIETVRALEDGPYVATHSRVTREDPNLPQIAVVHIFRFEKGQIAELWDLGQPVEKESPNENGPF